MEMPPVHRWAVSPFNERQGLLLDPFRECEVVPHREEQIVALAEYHGASVEATRAMLLDEYEWPIFRNSLYQVQLRWQPETMRLRTIPPKPPQRHPLRTPMPDIVHLSIKLIDKSPVHDWRHLQEIKNRLVGPEFEAIEIYPAESRVVDTANQYHLWAFGDPTTLKEIGFQQGRNVTYDDDIGGARQRGRAG